MSPFRPIFILVLVTSVVLILQGCSWYDNQTTYFNTYYNANRIMTDVEDEFAYQDENKRTKPRVLVPAIEGVEQDQSAGAKRQGTMDFLRAFIIDKTKLQPVATKVDSILIKGSKILANHPKSKYVEGSLFLMAKSYFYRQEWIPSQQKCVELAEQFADGEYSPDAHLLLAKNYLIQRKISQGKQALSRAVDVAWYRERWDILSEAFRIQAELALEESDLDGAVQPYKQAIAQSEDDEVRARWQVDLASIYYRLGEYEMAEQQFAKVEEYTPDPLAQFESRLYRSAALARLGKFTEAEEGIKAIEENRNFDEWGSFVAAERIALERLQKEDLQDPALLAKEKQADTSYIGRPELMAQNFQKAMSLYKQGDYEAALPYFAKSKLTRTPVYDVANKYFTLIKQWSEQHRKVDGFRAVIPERPGYADTVVKSVARERYALGRIHEQMGNADSAMSYYALAYDSTYNDDPERARYLFAQARLIAPSDPDAADSIMEVITERYPNADVAKEAYASLGFSDDVQIDDAAELYRSGTSFRRIKDWGYAEQQYTAVVANHPGSPYAPKALYALGWMYEREAGNVDSALHFYGQLIEKYPRSEYAKDVRASVEFALAKRNGVEVEDSLLLKDLDKELYERGKAGELDAMQQLLKNNQDALNGTIPGGALPNIPGVTPTDASGQPRGLNDMLQEQLRKAQGGVLPAGDTTRKPPPAVPPKP